MQDQISVTLQEEDFIDALRPHGRPRRLSFLFLTLALMLALLIVALLVRFPEARSALMGSPVIHGLLGAVILAASMVLSLLMAAPALRRRAAKSTLNHHPGMRDPIHYTFDADHFAVRTTYTQASYPWTKLWSWREGEYVLIVMPTPRNYYVIPKRDVAPAVLERLRGYLASDPLSADNSPRHPPAVD